MQPLEMLGLGQYSDIDENRCEEKIKKRSFFSISLICVFFLSLLLLFVCCPFIDGHLSMRVRYRDVASQTRLFFIRYFSFFILMKLEKSNVIHKFLFTNVMVKMPIVFHSTDIITNLFLKSFNRLIVLVAAVAVWAVILRRIPIISLRSELKTFTENACAVIRYKLIFVSVILLLLLL